MLISSLTLPSSLLPLLPPSAILHTSFLISNSFLFPSSPQIPHLPPRCPQTLQRVPLLPPPSPGPQQWSVEMVVERLGNIAACAEPGSTTR